MKISSTARVFLPLLAAASAAHGAKPTKTTYSYKGLSVSSDMETFDEISCLYTYMSFGAFESVEKTGGPPTPSAAAYMHIYTENFCTGDFTYTSFDPLPVPDLKGNINKGVTLQASFVGYIYSCSYYTYPCTDRDPYELSLSASFTPVGTPESGRTHEQRITKAVHYTMSSKGTTAEASVSIVLNGTPFVVPEFAYALIQKASYGHMEMTKVT